MDNKYPENIEFPELCQIISDEFTALFTRIAGETINCIDSDGDRIGLPALTAVLHRLATKAVVVTSVSPDKLLVAKATGEPVLSEDELDKVVQQNMHLATTSTEWALLSMLNVACEIRTGHGHTQEAAVDALKDQMAGTPASPVNKALVDEVLAEARANGEVEH